MAYSGLLDAINSFLLLILSAKAKMRFRFRSQNQQWMPPILAARPWAASILLS